MSDIAPAASVLLAGVGGGLLALAARELWVESIARSADYLASALLAVRRAGREGRLPSVIERRRLGTLTGIALGGCSMLVLGPGQPALAAALGPWLAGSVVAGRQRRFRRRLEGSIPAIAAGLADALAAGASLRGALADLAPTLEGPGAVEIARVRVDIALGVPPSDSLRALAERNDSEALGALVAAIVSQQRSGGDLAALLRRHALAEQERQRALADARAATSQARLTGGMVATMPVAAALLVELVAPGFVASMLAEPVAASMLIAALGLQLAGFVVIRRFGRAEL